MKKLSTLVALMAIFTSCCNVQPTLSCDKSNLTAHVECNDNELIIKLLNSNDSTAIISSPISLLIDGEEVKWELLCSSKKSRTEKIALSYGEYSDVTIPYCELKSKVHLSTSQKSLNGELKVRLFQDAMAYQLTLEKCPEGSTLQEVSRWIPADLGGEIFVTNDEFEPLGGMKIAEAARENKTPLIYKTEREILSIHECDLVHYPQLIIKGEEDGSAMSVDVQSIEVSGDVRLPYRVVMVGKEFKDLHAQKPIYFTMSPKAEGDWSWVEPGLCMWDWRVRGVTFDGFKYEVNTESLKRYVDFCAESNIRYFLLDAHWYKTGKPLEPINALDIKEVIAYGKEKNVGIFLYYDLYYVTDKAPKVDFELVAKTYAEFGAAGIKYGFLFGSDSQNKTDNTHRILEIAAKNKLLVVFHDKPVPFSGIERTYPNYINREYCHAQLDRRSAFNPRQFIKMACINMLAGHIDQTNGTFALDEMMSRSKGPKNEYHSTVSAEVARFFFTHTGALSVLIDAPEAYKQKADLFEFISSLPEKWDETKYLDMDYNSHVAVAKRSGDVWFASVVFGETDGKYSLDLDFLEPNTNYIAKIYRDAANTDYINNKEAYTIEQQEVNSNDYIVVDVPTGGGFSVHFEKN